MRGKDLLERGRATDAGLLSPRDEQRLIREYQLFTVHRHIHLNVRKSVISIALMRAKSHRVPVSISTK